MSIYVYVLSALVIAGIAVLAWAIKVHIETRDHRWIWAELASSAAIIAGMAAIVNFGIVGSVDEEASPATTTAVTTSIATSITTLPRTTPTLVLPTVVPLPTATQEPVETPSVSPPTPTWTETPTEQPPPVEEERPVREEYVSHVFVAKQYGLGSGADYPFYLIEEFEGTDEVEEEGQELPGAPSSYFTAPQDFIDVPGDSVELSFVDSDVAHSFPVKVEVIEYDINDTRHPTISIKLEDSTNPQTGIYGRTSYWEFSEDHSADGPDCTLVESDDDPTALTCSWWYQDLVAETEVRKDLYERGLEHALAHGVAKVNITLTQVVYDQLFEE